VPIPRGETRPTSERARQALFDIVGSRLAGSRFLDLFAGSGIFSFEAVSRGASAALAVDVSRRALETISALAHDWNIPVDILNADALAALPRISTGPPFGVVYADPPYDWPDHARLAVAIDRLVPLEPGAVVAVEHRSHGPAPDWPPLERLELRKNVAYGTVSITIFDCGHDV
jgi:16S rRNA (guanine966-N2)-methyltransferase